MHAIKHIRPRFKLTSPLSPKEILDTVYELFETKSDKVKGTVVLDHVTLDIVEDVHYFSPQLNFRVEPDHRNPDHSIVAGLISPRPGVWTMFVFIYFVVGVIGFFASSFGLAQWMINKPSPFVYAFPVTIVLLLSAYLVSKYGERLAAEQTETLKQFIREALDNNYEVVVDA